MVIVGRKNDPNAQYIGRGSPLGNPFRIDNQASNSRTERDRVIKEYRRYFEQHWQKNDAMLKELRRLYRIAKQGTLVLGCFCAPKPCHGDVIKEFLERMGA
jgi:hypothetical protein